MSNSDFDSDDDLRALLRGGDPAGSLSPADPAALAILLEDIMSADLDVRPDADEGSRATGTHGRNRLTWLVAAAAAAMIAGVGGVAISGLGNDKAPPSAGHQTTSPGGTEVGRQRSAGRPDHGARRRRDAGQVRGSDAGDPGSVPPGLPGHGHLHRG